MSKSRKELDIEMKQRRLTRKLTILTLLFVGLHHTVHLAPLFEGACDLVLKRRNGFDITRDILRVCAQGANKTHIVYAANLNSKRVNNYLEFCVRMKLLAKQFNGTNLVYHTTPEGVHFMRNYFGAEQRQNEAQTG